MEVLDLGVLLVNLWGSHGAYGTGSQAGLGGHHYPKQSGGSVRFVLLACGEFRV
jgi:hypothetical protein